MLDLRPIIIQIGDQVAVIGRVAEKLPDSAGKITIIEASQLETAQTLTRILRAVANWMWLVALAVAALAVWLARGRRRIELRALAIGVFAVGLLMLVVRRAAGGYLVDQLVEGRQRQAGGTQRVEHPDADSRRPCLGVDHPWSHLAVRSLVRR